MLQLDELSNLLMGAGSGQDPNALQRLESLKQTHGDELFTKLAEILHQKNGAVLARCFAAYFIKKSIVLPVCSNNSTVQCVVLEALTDDVPEVRKSVASTIALAIRDRFWPWEVVNVASRKLTEGIASRSFAGISGPLFALANIIEDNIELIDSLGSSPALIRNVVPLMIHEDLKIQESALFCIVIFLEQAGCRDDGKAYQTLQDMIIPIINNIFAILPKNPGQKTCLYCVKAIVLSLTFIDLLSDRYDEYANLVKYVMGNNNLSEDIRLEAVQFWRAASFFPQLHDVQLQQMPEVIPLLLRCMIYSEMELGMLDSRAEDGKEPDRPEDIKPRQAFGKTKGAKEYTCDDDPDCQDIDEETENYNLRRTASFTLDELSKAYGDHILLTVLTQVDIMMKSSSEWLLTEAAILSVGAITEGCFEGLRPHMQQLMESFLTALENHQSHFLIKEISLWSCGEMAPYFFEDEEEAHRRGHLARYVNGVLSCMVCNTKSLQNSATGSLETLLQVAERYDNHGLSMLEPFLPTTIQTVVYCLNNYQLKNRCSLLEAIETVCRFYGAEIAGNSELMQLLLMPLKRLWSETPDDSPLLIPYFECMASFCSAVGRSIGEEGALGIWERAINLASCHIQNRMIALKQIQAGIEVLDIPDVEFLIVAMDLISGLFDALGSSMEPLLSACDFIKMILTSCGPHETSPEIRRAAFGLIGDTAAAAPAIVQRYLSDVCELLVGAMKVECITDFTDSAASNAAWAIGEIIGNQVEGFPMIDDQMAVLIAVPISRLLCTFGSNGDKRNMCENCALTLGRIILYFPSVLQHRELQLSHFALQWCNIIRNVKNIPLKSEAVQGFLGATRGAPQQIAATTVLSSFFDVVASIVKDMSRDMKEDIVYIFGQLSQCSGSVWGQAIQTLRPATRQQLKHAFNI